MPHTLKQIPRWWAGDLGVGPGDLATDFALPGAQLTVNAGTRLVACTFGTIATTGATEAVPGEAPCTGTLAGVRFYTSAAQAASASNYITFAITNKGQAGAGSTAMLVATVAGRTTQAGVTAYGKYVLTPVGSPNNAVVAGDCFQVVATVTGTLPAALTLARLDLLFLPTT